MKAAFKEVPEAITNTLEVMQKCNLVMDFSKIHLPKFPVPEGMDDYGYLTQLCRDNFPKRYPGMPDEVKETARLRIDGHKKDRLRQLLFNRLGPDQICPRQRYSCRSGPRQRGRQRRAAIFCVLPILILCVTISFLSGF